MTSRWVRSPQVLWRRTTGSVLLLRADGGEAVSLTGPGVFLWELLEEPLSTDEAVAIVSDAYGVEPVVVAADIDQVLAELVDRGLVDRCR